MQFIKSTEFKTNVLEEKNPVVVNFTASWCGPCKMFAPILEQVATQLEGSADVYKVDIDESPDLAAQYGVMSVPTTIIFKDGKELVRKVGVQNAPTLLDAIENL